MKSFRFTVGVVGAALLMLVAAPQESSAQRIQALAAFPESLPPYAPPNKPVTRISDLLEKHQGHPNWSEVVFSDHVWQGEYISMAPGEGTIPKFYQDHRVFWFVQDGELRVEIEGQEPFIASKGYMVQVPKRLVYSMRTVGEKPSLRFEVTMANSGVMYPLGVTPPEVPGIVYQRVEVASAKGSYSESSPMYVDFSKVISGEIERPGQFSIPGHADPEAGYTSLGNVHIGRGPATTGPLGVGHAHLGSPEAWFVMEGQIESRFGDLPPFVADQGDVLYVPAGWYHNLRSHGPGMSTRIPLVVFRDSHVYQSSEAE
jgi:mannose-6-phosphate isomerase-like protein (cupin superfamily)